MLISPDVVFYPLPPKINVPHIEDTRICDRSTKRGRKLPLTMLEIIIDVRD